MIVQSEALRRHVHTAVMDVRWGDMDAMGHVNNTVYFRYLEQARIEWFGQIDAMANPLGIGPVIINAHCTFMKQLKYPDRIEVKTYAGAPGRSSFETMQDIRLLDANGAPGTLVSSGGAKIVWVDSRIEKSVPLPDAIRARLAGA
ncbi:MAG TPA: thioesterase family protein [Burkholderiaceae bacterium]